jgi:hypothetical protein
MSNAINEIVSDTTIFPTAREWYEWLVREEEKTVAAYKNKPKLLIADYRRERATARDYEGREILELLQNANDQAAELEQPGKAFIELSPEGLIVANTGLAFSVGGVASLQTSHLSPKRGSHKRLIGNKGLGFRAVLNWSKTPIILSNALTIAYCMGHAKRKLAELCSGSAELARLVETEQRAGDELILPLLSFPLYSTSGDLLDDLDDERSRKLFERCEALLIEGYDTVIGMPFYTTGAYEAASTQIGETRPEVLLFAEYLSELSFRRDGEAPVTWRRVEKEEVTEVIANDKPLGKWNIHRTAGEVPASIVESDQQGATGYEIVVAVPVEGSSTSSPLFSYFPTNITLPLPLVCHATLELEQNRKHIQQGRAVNSYVLGKLAGILAEIAEEVASRETNDPWAGCSLLIQLGDYPDDLKRERFLDKLIVFAKDRAIVPTLGGKPVKPPEARFVPGADASWLPKEVFPEVVPIGQPTSGQFLRLLSVPPLSAEEIKERIINSEGLSTDERVALARGLTDQVILRGAYTSALFVDTSGQSLYDNMRVFLAPGGGEAPGLPEWADIRFLNDDMRTKLARALRTRDVRELQQKLSGFGLLEYSLANVIRALVAEANRAERAHPEDREVYQTDLLRAVFELYVADASGGKRPDYPERSPLLLRNQRGDLAGAASLYLGRDFGTEGEITEALYGAWALEKMVDPDWFSNLTDSLEQLPDFLQWVGVAQWPRSVEEPNPDGAYLQHVLRSIKFPTTFGDKVVESAGKAFSPFLSKVQSVEGLDGILGNAEPDAIVAWLSRDDRALAWSRPAPEHASLKAYPSRVHNPRSYMGLVPHYVRWRLETTSWLRSSNGDALRPKDCVLGERAIEDLFLRPAMPDSWTLGRYGIQQGDILEGWRRAGVLTSLAYLERDEIYAKLLELPQRSPDGKLARPLYHWLLDASEVALGEEGPNQKEFLSRGKMWGRGANGQGYFPISELHHADVEGLPEALLRKLKIVDLRKRVGSVKVEKLFGVKPIDRAGIQQRVIHKGVAFGASDAAESFQTAKPYLYKLRVSQTGQLAQLQTLKDLRLELCWTLRAGLSFEGELIEYDVPVWGWLIEEKTLYVRSDPSKPISFSQSLLADSIGEALATVFRIADGGEFARMLVCSEDDRPQLLRRLRGESALEDIESIKAQFEAFQARDTFEARFTITEPPKQVTRPSRQEDEVVPEPQEPISQQDTTPPKPLTPLRIVEEEHVPAPPPERRVLQVKKVTSQTGGHSRTRRLVTNGDFCEHKAMEFEEASTPRRWPLPVGHITGYEGPLCDVLSFSSEVAKESFRQGLTRDLGTVDRFIEVKGRGNPTEMIELKGNEFSAAEQYGERYYLYRLFEAEDGTFELKILQNPLSHLEALQPAVYVSLDQAEATQRFLLRDGLRATSEELHAD